MMCTLQGLLDAGICQAVVGDARTVITGVKHDSRRVEAGDLFVAIDGVLHEGTTFVQDAIKRGAVAVLSMRQVQADVPVCISADPSFALAAVAHRIYGDPTSALRVVGITGTNGKTTTAYLVDQILRGAQVPSALCGTIQLRTPKRKRDASLTTPMADDLIRFAREALDDGARCLVMEVSSHALVMQRVGGVRFAVAAFTNLTQDHLDYHGDMASYEAAKRQLFESYAPHTSVINVDDAAGARMARAAKSERVWRCSTRPEADVEIVATQWQSTREGLRATVRTPRGSLQVLSPLVGKHNLENLLLAIGVCVALELSDEQIRAGVAHATGAPGRLQVIEDPRGVLVTVDYAHTPDALTRVLEALRPLTTGRLFAVFGCGGDRDPGKRPLMGAAVGKGADVAVVTSDNPRSESAAAILAQIEPGVLGTGMPRVDLASLAGAARGFVTEVDRARAIELAIGAARAGDTVLIAGKGHETYQIIGSQRLAFDDREVAARAIAAVGA